MTATAQTTRKARLSPKAEVWLYGISGLLAFALVLELVPRLGLVSPRFLAPFSEIVVALAAELRSPRFWNALAATMRAWAIGLLISVMAAAAIGMIIGTSNKLLTFTRSTIEFLRPIPSVALIPLVVLLFGTRLQATLVLVIYASFWQVLIQVLYGVQDVDPVVRETARSYRFSRFAILRHVVWPTTLPYLMTGIRLASAVALILAITSEIVIGAPGLGHEIALTQTAGTVSVMYAYVLVTGLIGVMINIAARMLEQRVLSWHHSVRSTEAVG